MGIGAVSISTSQKRELSGPLAPGTAHNGTSIDGTGLIVLGNDIGDPVAPAELLNDREIITNSVANPGPFSVVFTDAQTALTHAITADQRSVNSPNGAPYTERFKVGTDFLLFNMIGNGSISWNTGAFGATPALALSSAAGVNQGKWQIGAPINITKNPATLQVNGSISGQAMSRTMSSGTFIVNRDLDSNAIITNPNATGAVTITLPNMAFSGTTGFYLSVGVVTATTVLIRAFAGQTIYVGDSAQSSVGGSIRASSVGSFITLFCADQLSWFTAAQMGTWTLA